MVKVDVRRLRELAAERYLVVREHPAGDLLIWDYTAKAQFERYWTAETLMCRGLITTPDGEVVARPFPKFFNLEEHQGPLPHEPFDVYEKLDGSLGILYWRRGEPAIATRGAFASGQALRGTAVLRSRYRHLPLDRAVTYLFEIIYPENRVVVDYGDIDDLVLLAAIDTETGADLPLPDFGAFGMPVVQRHDGIQGLAALRALRETDEPNREGYVVRFRSGLRLKLKLAEYVRLHRLLTGVTPRRVWDVLAHAPTGVDGSDASKGALELLRGMPEEFADWVLSIADELTQAYGAIEQTCLTELERVPRTPDRRAAAEHVKACAYPPIVFRMLDGKPHAPLIWKLLYPEPGRPYATAGT